MIKLIIHTHISQDTRLFDKPTVSIGSSATEADVHLDDSTLQNIHLKIVEKDTSFYLINIANDPFTTLNGQCFGKKKLHSGDRIELTGGTILLFETTEDLSGEEKRLDSRSLIDQLENKIHSNIDFATIEFPESPRYETEEQETDRDSAPPLPLSSIKDSHLSETGEENETWYPESNVSDQGPHPILPSSSPLKKWVVLSLSILLVLTVITTTLIYLSTTNQIAVKEELRATKGIADIAMALTYARLHNLKPHNQNWTDHDFLKTHLTAVISDPHRLTSSTDIQSHFQKLSYSLRIYTSNDLSRFLLIAQPLPSLRLWVIPQPTVLIDSTSMEIHKTHDLRSLNRLLAEENPLEEENMKEIALFIKHEELVPLATLAKEFKANDFTPPSPLAKINPGSENLIYNAPRYYRLGKPLFESAQKLEAGNDSELTFLQKECKILSQLEGLALYISHDKQTAERVKRCLTAHLPTPVSLQFGWLSFDKKGDITHSELLHEQGENIAALETPLKLVEDPTLHTHPLYQALKALKAERSEQLTSLSQRLIDLIKAETDRPSLDFQAYYAELSQDFVQLCQRQDLLMREAIDKIEEDFRDTTARFQRIAIAKTVGLQESFDFSINSLVELDSFIEDSKQQLISEGKTMEFSFNNPLRQPVFNALEALILSSHRQEFDEKDRKALLRVLNQEWLIEPEERDFFLSEYDFAEESQAKL